MDDRFRDVTLEAIAALTAYLGRTGDDDQSHRELAASLVRERGIDALVDMFTGLLNLSTMLVIGAADREDKTPAELLRGIALALEQGRSD